VSDDSQQTRTILTINVGSSSLKAALYPAVDPATPRVTFAIDRIGSTGSNLIVDGEAQPVTATDHPAALAVIKDWIQSSPFSGTIAAVGHRVVHGGREFTAPTVLDPDAIARLETLTELDPDHMPQCLATIAAARRFYPLGPHVAVFDTAFHQTMPAVERTLPIPGKYASAGFERYGFHGLSYESVVANLRAAGEVPERLIVAHLGSGCSLCAIHGGESRATTMGFTPTGGVVMGTRSGDLDPGVVIGLMRQTGMDSESIEELLNKQSGLLGISGRSADMRDLLAAEADDPVAALAIAVFVQSIRKAIASLAAVLGGIDGLVFTGGIGEHQPEIRDRICRDLGFLGIELDRDRNVSGERLISKDRCRTTVRVVPSDEQGVLARAVATLIQAKE
jgi:acetate kinase